MIHGVAPAFSSTNFPGFFAVLNLMDFLSFEVGGKKLYILASGLVL